MKFRVFLLINLQLIWDVSGKTTERKTFPRQMIFPNKFIPMIKESTLFKARASSNDLSNFLKPKSHKGDSVTGQTRQNLMSSMGMDGGQSQEMGGGNMGGGDMGGGNMGGGNMGGGNMGGGNMGGTGDLPGAAGGAGLGGMTGPLGATEGEPGMDALGAQRGMEGGQGAMMGMNNQEGSQSPFQKNMMDNGINSMGNPGSQGPTMGGNNPPAGDPMGTLNDMMSNQGANTALGLGSQAFGPGGDANSNVVSMLNQIVGKEIPSESPVNPGSNSEQLWNELQKNIEGQKPSGMPYLDSENTHSTTEKSQQDSGVKQVNQAPTAVANSTEHKEPPLNSSSSIIATGIPQKPSTAAEQHPNTKLLTIQNRTSATDSPTKHQHNEDPNNVLPKTSSSIGDADLDEEQPLSNDMVKFLKGVKFVISQEPGNDIILGKKFSTTPANLNLKEENGIMKTVVASTDSKSPEAPYQNSAQVNTKRFSDNRDKQGRATQIENEEKIENSDILSGNPLFMKSNNKITNSLEYIKAANILRSASEKLKDPIAKMSTDVAIASILKVLSLGDANKISKPRVNVLKGGDIKDEILDKYAEAARVLATASKKLADPVAKKSTDVGIASILKVISLGEYTSKKTLVPNMSLKEAAAKPLDNNKYDIIAEHFAYAVIRTLRSPHRNLKT